jgi:PTH1 family peptidyl-tRNA hydrolase
MNESGRHIRELLEYYKVEPSKANLAVIHDDLDMPIGQIRGKLGGGTGGHNGIKSIIQEIDTQDFFRIKIGVGRHEHMEPLKYVIAKMDDERLDVIEKMIDYAAHRAVAWLQGTFDQGFKDSLKEEKDERDNVRGGGDQAPPEARELRSS